MATILVTGAAGFIASHVSEALLGRGDTVIGIDNFDPYYSRTLKDSNVAALQKHGNFQFFEADLRDAARIGEIVRTTRPEGIVHLGAKAGVRPSLQAPADYIDVNVTGTLHLVQAAAEVGVKQFILASSSSVYGSNAKVPFAEDDQTDSPESPYAATKKAAELLCFTYHRLTGMPITCLRFFTVYGPRQRPDLAINKFTRLIDEGKPIPFFGSGQSSRDYTFVLDTVSGVIAALDRPNGYQIYNLGNSRPITLSYLVETVGAAVGKPVLLDRLPDQPGDVPTTFADVSKAKRDLGYDPQTPFEEGIRRFVEWYRSTGYSAND
jgi:UDP-glucuronate 4-epimerase